MTGGKGKPRKSGKLVQGVGVNDADYAVCPRIGGKIEWCPFYRVWSSMLMRCYSESSKMRNPTYIGCSVVPEWLLFTHFKAWMEQQDWKGNQLDKDLITEGNKMYGPDTCVFVSKSVNSFMTESTATRGDYPIGVSLYKNLDKFGAHCHSGTKLIYLGLFGTAEEAHLAYKTCKRNLANDLASVQSDQRISDALIKRYVTEA